ncbi:MAG TPA: hypothetical protein VFH35_04210, partial [Ramlibacter sp.]|nr:hypothetical protein [Ramlibacter sp.]
MGHGGFAFQRGCAQALHGALGLRDATNARNFAGLNFDETAIATGVRYAHERGSKVLMAINT